MTDFKLGYSTGYWSAGPPAGALAAIKEADRLGFDSFWTSEAYGSDCFTPRSSKFDEELLRPSSLLFARKCFSSDAVFQ